MTPGEEGELVEEAARAILAYEARDGGAWRGRTALQVVEEALPEDAGLGDVLRVARRAVRRARELRGDPPRREGRAEGSRTESTLPLYGSDGGREDLRPL